MACVVWRCGSLCRWCLCASVSHVAIFSTTALAAPSFAAAATRAPIDHSFYVDEDEELMVAMTTVKPGSALEGCTIAQLERELDLSIILHKKQDGLQRSPDPNTVLQADARLVVFASLDTLARLGEMSEPCEIPERPEAKRQRSWLGRLFFGK